MNGRHTVLTAQTPEIVSSTAETATESPRRPLTTPRERSSFGLIPQLLMVTNALLAVLLAFQLFHRPKYEYMTTSPSDYVFNETMSKLGAAGWKTESCRRASDGSEYSPTMSYECVMSRPKLGW